MWKYEKPDMQILELCVTNVICTSGVTDSGTINENGDAWTETPFLPRN